jgi:hypothetical protein
MKLGEEEYQMSDWELVDQGNNTNNDFTSQNNSDWELVNNAPSSIPRDSNILSSLAKAPFRVLSDVVGGIANTALNIPNYINQASTAIPQAINNFGNNPMNAINQFQAGIAELGHNILNTPKNAADYISNRLQLLSPSDAESLIFPSYWKSLQLPTSQRDISQDINLTYGKPNNLGDELIRGIGRNAANIIGAKEFSPDVLDTINPMQLTDKSIADSVVKTGEKNQRIYGNKYDNFFDMARDKGLGNTSLNNSDIDLGELKKYSNNKTINHIEELLKNPDIENAHYVRSDLLGIQRDLDSKKSLEGWQKSQLNAVNEALSNIHKKMFADKEGNVDLDLKNKYKEISNGYENEVLPYTQNDDIKEYKNKKLLAKELLPKLFHGEFAAKRLDYHPLLKYSPLIKSALSSGVGSVAGELVGHPGVGAILGASLPYALKAQEAISKLLENANKL